MIGIGKRFWVSVSPGGLYPGGLYPGGSSLTVSSALLQARYTSKKYTTSVLSLQIAQQQLDELKSSLGEKEVSRLQAQYALSGGEKFYEDPTKVTCMSSLTF